MCELAIRRLAVQVVSSILLIAAIIVGGLLVFGCNNEPLTADTWPPAPVFVAPTDQAELADAGAADLGGCVPAPGWTWCPDLAPPPDLAHPCTAPLVCDGSAP